MFCDLREEYLGYADGDFPDAARRLALDLTRGDARTFKAGYSIPNAAIAANQVFPEVPVDEIERSLAPAVITDRDPGDEAEWRYPGFD